jgi:hypothetical protein
MRLVETLEMLSQARRYVADGEEFLSEQRQILDILREARPRSARSHPCFGTA